jgi:preprotein translocase subunit SecA
MAGRGTDIMLGRKLRIFGKTRNEKTRLFRWINRTIKCT